MGENLTDLINRALAGDEGASEAAYAATYSDLRRLAHLRLNRNARGTLLDTTSLVHESFLRFVRNGTVQVDDRAHFLRYAARAMRSVTVDTVRERATQKRGGEVHKIAITTDLATPESLGEAEIMAVHEALEGLARHDERMVQVVEMRYFAGMTEKETAAAMQITDRTVRRIWQRARVWLAAALE